MAVGDDAYFRHKNESPTGKSQIWHVTCYERTKGGSGEPAGGGGGLSGLMAAAMQGQGAEPGNGPESGQEPGNSAGSGQGPQQQGGQMDPENGGSAAQPPKISDLVCQCLFDEEKLMRHFHREDLKTLVDAGPYGHGVSQYAKAELASLIAWKSREAREAEEENPGSFLVNRLQNVDDTLRHMVRLPERPNPSDDPQVNAQQVQQAQEEVNQALEEMEKALKEKEEAEKRAEQAEGRVVKIETPEGQTITLDDKHQEFPKLAQLVAAGVPVMVVGPAGGGKTEACRALAAELEQEFVPLSLGPQTTQASLFGYTDAQGRYVRTPFRDAFENGGLILLDEFDRCNERVSVTLNAAIAQRYCSFPDGTVDAHKNCVFVAAANTTGHGADRQYVSARQQDSATLDRFAVLAWPYDERFETKLAHAQGLDAETTDDWLKTVRMVRQRVGELALRYLVSPRASIQGVKLMASGADKALAMDTVLFRGWKHEDREKVMQS
jgi:hypothetical protein